MDIVASMRSLGRRYLALWVGQALAQLGTYVAFFSIPLLIAYILGEETSALDTAIAYALENVPIVLTGLVGGVLLDRWQLRPVIIATHLIRASVFFYLSATVGDIGVGQVFALAFVLGSMSTMFDGALYALLPSIVRKDQLPRANSLITATIQAMFAFGPLLAGVLAAVFAGPEVGLFLTGLLFVGAAFSMKWVGRVARKVTPPEQRGRFLTEAANGLRYVWADPRLRITTIAAAVPNLVVGFIEGTWIILYYDVIGVQNEAQAGFLLSMLGVGGVLGAFLAPSVTARIGLGRALIVGLAITGAGLFAFMFSTFGVIAVVLQIVWMAGVSIINVPLTTIRQIYSAESMLGRVITASRAIGWATIPLGALLGGWLGSTEQTYPWVARMFPLLMLGTGLWLFTTVIWSDTFGPDFEGKHSKKPEDEIVGQKPLFAVDRADEDRDESTELQ